ncbi:complex I subunit 5 family protein [Gracilimonas mengyeensis]|uniref:Multisubunit sodium/proton antiporter, MrpD subunit n=1 Tax=Gracilimonas mengyeensis TaxID=1302730 RepID=A0A521ASS3_9BACT|nr:proton-conducting transporter membrane subunit [Gracilimonas mengyeensis]SMO37836.1 multisubunit sodium/proton antiporter, MrpD subunit [Gracilimonas mengyeensis]
MTGSNIPALIPATYILFAILIPVIGLWRSEITRALALLGSGIATFLSALGFINYIQSGEVIRYYFGGWMPPIGIEFVYDGLAAFIVLVINAIAFLVLIHSKEISKLEFPGRKMPYYTISMLMMLGFNGMVLTGDLFNLYVFLEISSLSSYALIAIGSKRAPYSAFRYLIIGTVGGSLYLLGVGFLYTVTGTLNIIDMHAMLPQVIGHSAVVGALILMVIGVGVKAALFPLHGWLPDSYTFASSTSSALIAPIGTKVAAYILLRVMLFLFGVELIDAQLPVTTIVGIFAGVGILYGSIMAIAQSELKKMLAYSSISQIGYIIMGISLANPFGFIGAVLHVLNHALMKALLFLVSGSLRTKEGHSLITKFDNSYRKKYPWTMVAFTTAAISMVGLPPLAGFFSKWYLALGTIENSNWMLLAVILISSLLNAVYFFRILEKVYLNNPDAEEADDAEAVSPQNNEVGFSMMFPMAVMAIGLLVVGIFNAYIVNVIFTMFPAGF